MLYSVGPKKYRANRFLSEPLERRLLLAQATQIVFTSNPVSLLGGNVSPAITIEFLDSENNPAVAPVGGQVINLRSTSTEGFFLSSNNYITSVTIPAGSSTASFQYQDNLNGTPILTASATGLISGTQQETIAATLDPFLQTSGINIRNNRGTGDIVPLHGVNLGGYLVMEGWMTPMDSSGLPDDYSVLQTLDNRFGVATEQSLIATYQQNWITTADLDNIKAMGFNVIRLPFWWGDLQTLSGAWRSDAFAQMDWLINQAWQRGIYTILDFHGVVGGQSTDQSTAESGLNQYWTSSADQTATASIWEQIAAHYKNNPAVAGYDLINEPTGAPNAAAVWTAYNSLYHDIRAIDPDHMIVMEGTFGNWDWNELPNPSIYGWTNVVYQMHEYQFSNSGSASAIEAGTNNQITDFNNHKSWNVPDYVGEFNDFDAGANPTGVWQYTIQQYDSDNINWTMWSYKTTQTLAPNNWGVYAPRYWAQTPNIQMDSAATIAHDWTEWTTTATFTVTTMLQQSLAQPVAVNNEYGVAENGMLAVPASSGVLANDFDINAGQNGIQLSATLVDPPAHGQLTMNADGSFTYIPNSNFVGADIFRYRVYDGFTNSSALATVTLQVASPAFPAGWSDADVGLPSISGSAQFNSADNTWTLAGGGAQIGSTSDQFNYSYQSLAANGAIVALVSTATGIGAAETGIMIRAGLGATANQVFLGLIPNNGIRLDYRDAADPKTAEVNPNTGDQTSYWVKLVRIGSSITGYISPDGNIWTQVGSAINLGSGPLYIGLAVTARNNANLTTGNFQYVNLITDSTPPTVLAANLITIPTQQIAFQFSQDVAASLHASDLQITPILGGSTSAASTVSFNSQTDTATFTLASPLSAGIYTATLPASQITNTIGTHAATDHTFTFLYAGDGSTLSLPGNNQTYTIQQLSLAPSARLDINQNTLIIQYPPSGSPAATIASLLSTAYATGQWTGPGIASSAAAADLSRATGVGYFDDGSQITIQRTWYGDTNLDGQISADDVSLMMLGQALDGKRWQDGNFNYDTQVDADDWIKLMYGLKFSQEKSPASMPADPNVPLLRITPTTFAQISIASNQYFNDLLDSPQSVI